MGAKGILLALVAGAVLIGATASTATTDMQVQECRYNSPSKIVRCAANRLKPPGGVQEALSVWSCESNFGIEPPHTDLYHGPFQYLRSTFKTQFYSMPDVHRWFETKPFVHSPRSNIITAIAWAARHGWGPWSCA